MNTTTRISAGQLQHLSKHRAPFPALGFKLSVEAIFKTRGGVCTLMPRGPASSDRIDRTPPQPSHRQAAPCPGYSHLATCRTGYGTVRHDAGHDEGKRR